MNYRNFRFYHKKPINIIKDDLEQSNVHKHSHARQHDHDHDHDHDHGHHNDHHNDHHHDHDHDHDHDHHHDHSHENHWLKATLGLLWGVGMLAISLASSNIPMLAYYAITGLTTLMTFYLGNNVYKNAWHSLLEKKSDTTTLYTISTLTIVGVSIASIFVPGLPMMFEAAPLVLGFWHLGEGIEHTLTGEINKKLDVRDCIPPMVLLKGEIDEDISVKQLVIDDIIIVKKGSVIPVDGVLTEAALLYTTRIDGSPYLKKFKAGDIAKAGMRLADFIPSLEMRVTKTYENSYLSLIAKNIDKANDQKAPIEIFANKVLKYFIPGLLGIAMLSGLVIGTLFSPAIAIQCIISVLVSACPCALSLITPMAVKIGMKKAAEQGINFTNGKALQAAADIDSVVFDLNGTLTKGEIEVQSLNVESYIINNIENKSYLRHIAFLEEQSDHPVAKIIRSYIQNEGIDLTEPLQVTAVDKSHHSGIKGIIDGEMFMIGNKDMLLANGIEQINEPFNDPENGSIYFVRGTKVFGQIALFDPLRMDAIATVKKLISLGKKVHICTGADLETAEKYAMLLGIPKENIRANSVGAVTIKGEVAKSSYIEELRRIGCKVSMVGDAANDLTAIACSDVGISVKSSIGDDITEQYAGIVVQQGQLFPIAVAFDVAEKTKNNIYQNLFVSLTYNSAITLAASGLFIAIGFTLNPVVGVALMVLESTIVLMNLYRFKNQKTLGPILINNQIQQEDLSSVYTTAKVLEALGNIPKTTPKSDVATQSTATFYKIGSLFAFKERSADHEQQISQQEQMSLN